MADIRVRILACELVYPSGTFPDPQAAVDVTSVEINGFMGEEYDGQVAVLHLTAAYDPEPEPSLPDVPEPDPAG